MAHPVYTPQLATLITTPPSGPGWCHEIKLDGYRIGCRIRDDRVSLISRNGKDWTSSFPDIVAAVRTLGTRDALLDGEVAMVLRDGRTSFQALQNARGGGGEGTLVYFVFDLLRLDGASLEARALTERKARLKTLLAGSGSARLRFSDHVEGPGDAFLQHACAMGLEGIVSKRLDGPYVRGRSRDWVKSKCGREQEFVIGGFTDPEGSRAGLGALLIGYYENGALIFAGKVGTGFTHSGALELRARLDRIEVSTTCPFVPPPPRAIARRAHWVKPDLVCEVSFTEWTSDGMARHPSFHGLRADKRAAEVRREREQPTPPAPPSAPARAARARSRIASSPPSQRGEADVAGVRISHPDRVLYPEPRLTKADLARYYERIAEWIVPHVAGRPLTLVRCPEGLGGKCFFMKHSKVWAPGPLRRVRIREKTKLGEYLIADDLPGVVGLVQMGVLEIHTWNSTFARLETPNRLVIDLDPGERVTWPQVIAAARVVRKALEALDLESFCKTTGGRGLHVVVPLAPKADWSECLAFTRALAEAIERIDPDVYTTRFAKRGREEKILIDYLRNNRTNTSIAAYSARARAGAPVSLPIAWDELKPTLSPASFTVETVPSRLARRAHDPWIRYWTSRQKLTAARLKAVLRLG